MFATRHVTYLGISILAALAVSLLLSVYGAHGLSGAFALYAGYCGGFVNWKLNQGRVSYALITGVNAIVYFAVCEIAAVVLRYGRSPKTLQQNR